MTRKRVNQRGVALVVVAIFMVVIMGFTVLGVDVARLAHVATEVQNVADAAARGGANALIAANAVNGDGVIGAHRISSKNGMNGVLAPNADVKVDEGFWDNTNGRFQCCTNASPCCINKATAPFNQVCEAPTRDCSAKHTAVLAMPRTVVDNIFAGIFDFVSDGRFASAATSNADNKHSPVEKLAVAMAGGPADSCRTPTGCNSGDWKCYCEHGIAPCLPIAAPSCKYQCSDTSCVLPTLQVSSNSDSAAWTGFEDGANTTNVKTYLSSNTGTGAACGTGNGKAIDIQEVGPDINVTNGISGGGNSPFSMVQCLIGQAPPSKKKNDPPPPPPQGCTIDSSGKITGWGGTVFSIPIFDLDACTTSMNQAWPVVGFATVQITNVNLTGSPNTISLTTVKNTTATGAKPGGECFQTDCRVTMTQ